MRQAYASSFEYGTHSNANVTLSRDLELANHTALQNPAPKQLTFHTAGTKVAPAVQIKSGIGRYQIRQSNDQPQTILERSNIHNESSFLEKIVQEAEQHHAPLNQLKGANLNHPVYYQKVYTSQVQPQVDRTRNVAMNNNIHINMKFAPLNDLGIVPSQIILTPKITSSTSRNPGSLNQQQIDFQAFSVTASGKKRLRRISSKSSKVAKSTKSTRSAKKSIQTKDSIAQKEPYLPSTKRL